MGTVYIELNELLQKYLRKEFDSQSSGTIVVNRNNLIGKFISCNTRWSKEKPFHREKSIPIEIPDTPYLHMELYYGYMTREDERRVNDFIQAKFDMAIEQFFTKAYTHKFLQKDIIAAIIDYYDLPNNLSTFDMLKKRDFRRRKKVSKIIAEIVTKT